MSIGNGSTLPGHRLSSALRSTTEVAWARAAGAGVVVLALAGCAVVATCWWRGPVAGWCRVGMGGMALVVLGVLALQGAFPASRWGSGAVVTVIASVMLVAAGSLNLQAQRTEETP